MRLKSLRDGEDSRLRGGTAIPSAIHPSPSGYTNKKILVVAFLIMGLSLLPRTSWIASAHADQLSDLMNAPSDQRENFGQVGGPNTSGLKSQWDSCLIRVPTPKVRAGLHRVVQLVNCSEQDLLGAANAAQQKGGQPVPVMPQTGTWLIKKAGSPNNSNVLTIDIPLTWEDTKCPPEAHGMCQGIVGPRLWARTGCRYDLGFDKAQCETGGCGGRYDCSAARLANSVGTAVSEWTFAEPVNNSPAQPPVSYLKDSPDISAVDGANLNMDIQPLINGTRGCGPDCGGDPHDPFDVNGPGKAPHDIQWLAEQYPLTMHGQDARASCAPSAFQLTRSILTTTNPYGFVFVNAAGQPINANGAVDNSTVACFSNCGQYEFPAPPDKSCTPSAGSRCYYWKSFCLGDPSAYGITHPCTTDRDCPLNGACWIIDNSHTGIDHTCQGRAFVKASTCFPNADGTANPNCPYVTYQYGYTDDTITPPQVFKSTQPPLGRCSDVSSDSNSCIGDDTLHKVMSKAYTWPNDPQVYGGDSPAYRVIFAPGGTGVGGNAPGITPPSTIPFCKDLPGAVDVYGYSQAVTDCSNPINYGALFGLAKTTAYSKKHNEPWGCDVNPLDSGDKFIICKWNSPAKVNQIGLRANFNSAGSTLPLSVLPGSLLQAGDLLLASITFNSGAGTPKLPTGWTQVPGASVISGSNDQTMVWYHFVVTPNGEPANYTWTWTTGAFPSGGITVWRGVNRTNPFDATASVNQGSGANATAPVLSIFGAGGATGLVFGLPASNNPGIGTDETGALVVNGGPASGTYYAHLVADRIGASNGKDPGATDLQTTTLTSNNGDDTAKSDWTAITIALKPKTSVGGFQPRPFGRS
jgi:Thaumatin family